MPIFSSLKGKRVLITGASGGIGRSMSYLFAKSGATLGIHYNEKFLVSETEAILMRFFLKPFTADFVN